MFTNRSRKRSRRSGGPEHLQKPRGGFHSRVRHVGPEHFGIVSVDCARARSKWMLGDFYGKVLVPPTEVEHDRVQLDAAIAQVGQARGAHRLHEVLVAIERTGRYHQVVQRAFAAAGYETRLVHPFATKQFRQPANPGNKTDDTDLAAIHRAAVNGFALSEPVLDESWRELQLLIRQRRDLVQKSSTLCCQIRAHLEAAWPGFAACFDDLWSSALAWQVLRRFEAPAPLATADLDELATTLRREHVGFKKPTLARVLSWARQAATAALGAARHRLIALALEDDRAGKALEIQALERVLAGRLVTTPYVLLLSFPGINVVSAADFAGEMGPITNYANARRITGRAGLYPSRYQSDRVDHAHGPLIRCCNRSLRAVILIIADNLIACNQHFNALATRWRGLGKDPRHTRVKIALRFCRIAFQLVAGRQVFRHPCIQERHYILDKLNVFHREHHTPMPQTLADLQAAIAQLPHHAYEAEARPLAEQLARLQTRRRGPQPLASILPLVLARLGVPVIQSTESGEEDLS